MICQRETTKVILLSAKVKVLNKERKISYGEVTKIYGKNKFSSHEIVKMKKEIPASFAIAPQAAKSYSCNAS